MDEAKIVDMLGRMGHQFADPHSRLAVGFERIRAFEDQIVATVEDVGMPSRIQSIADRGRYRLAIELVQ